MIGRRLPVLFEAPGRHSGQLKGRSPYLQPVHAEAPESLIGCVVEVEIEGLGAASLRGRPVALPRTASALPAASLAMGA